MMSQSEHGKLTVPWGQLPEGHWNIGSENPKGGLSRWLGMLRRDWEGRRCFACDTGGSWASAVWPAQPEAVSPLTHKGTCRGGGPVGQKGHKGQQALGSLCSVTKTRHVRKDNTISPGLDSGEGHKVKQFPNSGNRRAGPSPQARDQGSDFR